MWIQEAKSLAEVLRKPHSKHWGHAWMSSLMTAKRKTFEGYTSSNPCGCKTRLLEVHSEVSEVTQICTSRENYGFQRFQSLDRGCWFSWSAWFSLRVLNTRIIPSWVSEITSCIHKEKQKRISGYANSQDETMTEKLCPSLCSFYEKKLVHE